MNDHRVMHPDTGDIHWADPTCVKALCQTVVVIDPEDHEQVERLASRFHNEFQGERRVMEGGYIDAMQAALREFANPTPPKPDEPTGLGAVVRDRDGWFWVRVPDPSLDKPWRDVSGIGARRHWQIVDAVEVLSEGVQP